MATTLGRIVSRVEKPGPYPSRYSSKELWTTYYRQGNDTSYAVPISTALVSVPNPADEDSGEHGPVVVYLEQVAAQVTDFRYEFVQVSLPAVE